eukprot:2703845-Pleurochrysis_carterae.AAC.1
MIVETDVHRNTCADSSDDAEPDASEINIVSTSAAPPVKQRQQHSPFASCLQDHAAPACSGYRQPIK